MPRHRGRQIWVVWMPHNNMPSACDDVKAIGSLETAKVVLPPTQRRLTHMQCIDYVGQSALATPDFPSAPVPAVPPTGLPYLIPSLPVHY